MTIETIMFLIAGLGAFLVGFNLLSDNLSKLANSKMRNVFNKVSQNKFVGVGLGAAITALIQSSSGTTVMLIGFVNAGLISLVEAVPFIMGANIGSTITAQIAALESFDFALYAMIFAFIGVFLYMLAKKDKYQTIGLALAGLGLLFFGLETMSEQMSVLRDEPIIREAMETLTNPILLILVGALVTAVLQSSGAVTAIVISMVSAGIMVGGGGNGVFFLILGTNIGTCVTGMISSIGTTANARRTAIIHLLFNVIGSLLFIVILLIWKNFYQVIANLFEAPGTQVAMFHTFFNCICTIVFLPFCKVFVKIAMIIVPEGKNQKREKVASLDERFLRSPGVAIGSVLNEVKNMSVCSMKALETAYQGFMDKDVNAAKDVLEHAKKASLYDSEITSFLVKISASNIGLKDEKIISAIHSTIPDIERLSELAENITRYTKHYVEEELAFSDTVMVEIKEMFDTIKLAYEEALEAFNLDPNKTLDEAERLEDTIDTYKKKLLDGHMARLKEGKCKPESSGVFINFVNNLERAGDHLFFISSAIIESKK